MSARLSARASAGWRVWLFYVLLAAYVIYAGINIWGMVQEGTAFDLMLLSGGATCLAGLHLIRNSEARLRTTLLRLRDSAVMDADERQVRALLAELDNMGRRWGRAGAAVAGLTEAGVVVLGELLIPWKVCDDLQLSGLPRFAYMITLLTLAATSAGYELGRLAAIGRLQLVAAAMDIPMRAQAGAADGMGGLAPLVRFLRAQSALALLPAIWIGVWLVMTAFEPWFSDFGHWRFPVSLLLVLALFYALLGFRAPAATLETLIANQQRRAEAQHGNQTAQQVLRSLNTARTRAWPRSNWFTSFVVVLLLAVASSALRIPELDATAPPLRAVVFGRCA